MSYWEYGGDTRQRRRLQRAINESDPKHHEPLLEAKGWFTSSPSWQLEINIVLSIPGNHPPLTFESKS